MKIKMKPFEKLSLSELYEILRLRQEVFIVEQGGRYQDLDQIDYRSLHIFSLSEENEVTGCVRIFLKPDDKNTIQIGRLATRIRKQGIGTLLMKQAILVAKKQFHVQNAYLTGRKDAKDFYLKCGYKIIQEHEHYFEFSRSI